MHLIKQQAGQFLVVFNWVCGGKGGVHVLTSVRLCLCTITEGYLLAILFFISSLQAFWNWVYTVYTQQQARELETERRLKRWNCFVTNGKKILQECCAGRPQILQWCWCDTLDLTLSWNRKRVSESWWWGTEIVKFIKLIFCSHFDTNTHTPPPLRCVLFCTVRLKLVLTINLPNYFHPERLFGDSRRLFACLPVSKIAPTVNECVLITFVGNVNNGSSDVLDSEGTLIFDPPKIRGQGALTIKQPMLESSISIFYCRGLHFLTAFLVYICINLLWYFSIPTVAFPLNI